MIGSTRPMLFDIRRTHDRLREAMKEHLGPAVWYSSISTILNLALDHFFHGSILAGEREVEKRLIKYGLSFEDAVKLSRKVYDELRAEFILPGGDNICSIDCEYRYYSESLLVYVIPLVPLPRYCGKPIPATFNEEDWLEAVERKLYHRHPVDAETLRRYEKARGFP